MTEKIDVRKRPVVLGAKCDPAKIKPGGDKYVLTVLGEPVIVTDDQALGYLAIRLTNRFTEWFRAAEAHCNEQADMILSDMCKDSIAFRTGYDKGADVLAATIKNEFLKVASFSESPKDLKALLVQLTALVDSCRKHMPAADPDRDGFRDRD